MGQPHKHAEVIKAWADGAEIQFRSQNGRCWVDVAIGHLTPGFSVELEYRVKPEPHKWQKEMDAQAAGKCIQMLNSMGEWVESPRGWVFDGPQEYRIKPEKVVRYARTDVSLTRPWADVATEVLCYRMSEMTTAHKGYGDDLRLTFEDGKLVKAEVL